MLTFVDEPNICKFPDTYKSPPNIVAEPELTINEPVIVVSPDTCNVPSYLKPLSP